MSDEPDERGFFAERPLSRLRADPIAALKPPQPAPHYRGHRQRLRDKVAEHGHGVLADYELLELLLYRSIPQRDTKPIAKALLTRFGSFAEVLGAPEHLLREVKGVGESVAADLKAIAAASSRMARSQVIGKQVLSSWQQVLEYCRAAMAFEPREQFRIIFLDKKNQLIGDEVQQQGTVDHTPAYPREVLRRAIELSASAVVLVHNHPSGDPSPSRADIDMTHAIIAALKPLSIAVHDHLIVGTKGYASLKGLGMI